MSTNIQPLADYVVAQAEEAESKTASGIFLPENAQAKTKVYKVLEVGPDVKRAKVGDKIVYKGFSETSVPLGRNEYVLVRDEDIIATVK